MGVPRALQKGSQIFGFYPCYFRGLGDVFDVAAQAVLDCFRYEEWDVKEYFFVLRTFHDEVDEVRPEPHLVTVWLYHSFPGEN